MTSEELADWVAGQNTEALLADGFEAGVIGLAERSSQPTLVGYDAPGGRCSWIGAHD
jgi:hypothetical protein